MRRAGAPALYVAGLASIVALAGYAAHKAAAALIQKLNAVLAETTVFGTGAPVAAPVVEKRVVLNDEWKDAIRSETFWRGRGSSNSSSGPSGSSSARNAPVKAPPPHTAVPEGRAPAPQHTAAMRLGGPGAPVPSAGGTFRTMCVRLCDGYYWPISFITTSASFTRDSAACEKSCSSPARLFVYKNPGGEPDEMEDLKGKPYKLLKAAFAYRTAYDETCTCKPHPWEPLALDQHRLYALEAKKVKGDRAALPEIKQLQQKIEEQRRILAAAAKASAPSSSTVAAESRRPASRR